MNRQEAKRQLMAHMYAMSDRMMATGIEIKWWTDKLKNHECNEWETFEGISDAILTLFPEVGLTDLAGKLYLFLKADLQSR